MRVVARGEVRRWVERAWILAGKGATGLLPVVMLGICSRVAGAAGLGLFAVAFSLAQSVGEFSDFSSQRHVARVQLAPHDDNGGHVRRLQAFNALRLLALLAGSAVAIAVMPLLLPRTDVPAALALVVSAAWLFLNNSSYASALARGSFRLVGGGPWLGLVAGVAVSVLLARMSPGLGLWTVVIGLHAGKAFETIALCLVVGRPRFRFDGPSLRYEWGRTRHLMLVGLVSAANARLLVPLTAAVVGVVGAGYISVGLNLQAGILLVAVAMSVPAFRAVVDGTGVASPRDAFRLAARDWYSALLLSAVLTAGFLFLARPLTGVVVGRQAAGAVLPISLVVLCAPLETLSIFAGVFYHAAHQDARFFRLSVVSTLCALCAVAAGGWAGGTRGAALAFVASRVASAAILNGPLLLDDRAARAAERGALSR